jgi:NAD(P)-dependent dehydrogenase (short-subunit alcohol dehydrogenase family)
MEKRMDTKIAVVTGAAQGIGREYARALGEDGMHVVVADIKRDGAEETADLIVRSGGKAAAAPVDVSDPQSARQLAQRVRNEFGKLHVLVNNAALFQGMRIATPLTVDIEYWRKLFSINLDGVLIMTQALAPLMIETGWGRIVNQSSTAAYSGGGDAYSVSKTAVSALTQGLAAELGPKGITVNAIAPGPIGTDAMHGVVPNELLQRLIASMPISREGTPQDLCGPLRFLVSDGAGWITGHTLIVDGGYTKRL